MLQGNLFTRDFLLEGIRDTEDWQDLSDAELEAWRTRLIAHFNLILKISKPSEAETEDSLICPALRDLGWRIQPKQTLAKKGRENVPDALLFASKGDQEKAIAEADHWKRFKHGRAIVEAKRWDRLLDREDLREKGDDSVPSTQMLRYLSRVDVVTQGKLRWGMLTNGRIWRLYFQGALSVSEDFLEIDMAKALSLPGYPLDLLDKADPRLTADHALRLFIVFFRPEAFLPTDTGLTFLDIARVEGRKWEERVARDLSNVVFDEVFPKLAKGIVENDPQSDEALGSSYLAEIREATLVFLYRLLFVLFAEDRNLLPDETGPYKDYSVTALRQEIAKRHEQKGTLSTHRATYWPRLREAFAAVGEGDDSLGIPPYNGGLFAPEAAPILNRVKLPDALLGEVLFRLSHQEASPHPRYINYRDLSVQQLGSIYERILEYGLVADKGSIAIRLYPYARKGSGSYYTPEELVRLIIDRAIGPLVDERLNAFRDRSNSLASKRKPKAERLKELYASDPASRILDLKACDPAMGSGHFLVSLVDWLADRVLAAMAEANEIVDWADGAYRSPLAGRIAEIRKRIVNNATKHKWPIVVDQLDDRHIVRRMILKRVIYGVDKNPMAVELAKVSLWLHTFTVGAPLSFLDHHLRCGDSLFGESVRAVMDWAHDHGGLLINDIVRRAKAAASAMRTIEEITDADISEIKSSREAFEDIEARTRPLTSLMDLVHALRWMNIDDKDDKTTIARLAKGDFGDPVALLTGTQPLPRPTPAQCKMLSSPEPKNGYSKLDRKQLADARALVRLEELIGEARLLVAEQRFFPWEASFPDVWRDWESLEPTGGFDAVIGNPPWDRIKFQEVEWFAARRPEIARAQRAADRRSMVEDLKRKNDPLVKSYERAADIAEAASRVAHNSGAYPLLSGGDTNIYSLFVERALRLIKSDGIIGLLAPSGIASDLTASTFFRSIAGNARLAALFDFENKKVFFPDVDSRFKFCTFIAGGTKRHFDAAQCAFFLHDVDEIGDKKRSFVLTAQDFLRVNPNTGTAPIFRTRRDAEITKKIYEHLPVLVNRSDKKPAFAYPIRYCTMFHMTNDSSKFITKAELEKTAYPTGGNRWRRGKEEFVPLYEGKMVQMYDHRAASVVVNPENINRPAQPEPATEAQHADADWLPEPQFWVNSSEIDLPPSIQWVLGFKEITAPTNMRSMIAALLPRAGYGNKIPILMDREIPPSQREWAPLLVANLNSVPFDFIVRQKVHGQTLNLFLLEQLPVVAVDQYSRTFGSQKARNTVCEEVLRLTYTAHDMAPFARDMGFDGPPFPWDQKDRMRRRAKLDALYFLLYGIAERDDVSYIFSTFPIVEREDMNKYGRYLSRDLCLAYMNALDAGDPDAMIELDRQAAEEPTAKSNTRRRRKAH